MVTEIQLFEYGAHCSLEFCLWGLDAAARIKTRADELRRRTRHLRTGDAKCLKVTVGFWDIIVNCNKFVI
jgi:hypothetical protein